MTEVIISDIPRWHRWGEPVAVGLNLAYTVGYQNSAAWTFVSAAVGSAIFMVLCWQRQLKLESALWLFYIGMAAYGAYSVQSTWPPPQSAEWTAHGISILLGGAIWLMLFWIMRGKSWKPGLDGFTTVGSIIATYWMLQFVHANWIYWIVINAAATALYASRGLKWGTALFAVYTVLALEGWFNWI